MMDEDRRPLWDVDLWRDEDEPEQPNRIELILSCACEPALVLIPVTQSPQITQH